MQAPSRSEVSAAASPSRRVKIGLIAIDALEFDEAVDAIEGLVGRRQGGTVFTPNVDHFLLAEDEPDFRVAYEETDLSLVDGTPVMWAASLLGSPLPAKISGSDLIRPLSARAAARGWRVYLLGGRPGIAAQAKEILEREYPGLQIVGTSSPMVDLSKDVSEQEDVLEAVRAARPDLLFLALGSPKQEIWAHRIRGRVGPAVMVGIGATLDFVTGAASRSPPWMSAAGLEWVYRLAHEPQRLWRRYLLRDPRFLAVLAREALSRLSRDGRA
jgi:N-acetylglucosaminyldiphosphoundecaprenol N-acetyl-beta-D-mannosaminyltransferase